MLAEHEQRFARIISDYLDYGELLHRAYVSSPDGVDPEAWRADIRAQARRDKIRVITLRAGDRAIAARGRTISDHEVRAELDRANRLRQLAATARALGHEPGHWLRSERRERLLLSALRRPDLRPHRRAAGRRRRGVVGAVSGAVVRADRRLIPASLAEAIAMYEPLLTDLERILGTEHPNTLIHRHNLAFAYRAAGRVGEAVAIFERLLADCERVLGPTHPSTLNTRQALAVAYRAAGRDAEAAAVLKDRDRGDAR
jgi:tetratricopeptide (TPR) repeat protein